MKMNFLRIISYLATILMLSVVVSAYAADKTEIGITTDGACAIIGMTAEQGQLLALQRARAAAIEQAAGVRVSSGSLVINTMMAGDFIKTYSRGHIVKEKVEWLPLGQYQKDASSPPIPEYRVKLTADIKLPREPEQSFGLSARSSQIVYRAGEKAYLTLTVGRPAQVAIFNITADDKVTMLLPNRHDVTISVIPGKSFVWPDALSRNDLEMQPLTGHKSDSEAFLLVAMEERTSVAMLLTLFDPNKSYGFSEFFEKFSSISDGSEESILTYQVTEK